MACAWLCLWAEGAASTGAADTSSANQCFSSMCQLRELSLSQCFSLYFLRFRVSRVTASAPSAVLTFSEEQQLRIGCVRALGEPVAPCEPKREEIM